MTKTDTEAKIKSLEEIVLKGVEAMRETRQILEDAGAITGQVREFIITVDGLRREMDRAFGHLIERIDNIEQHVGINEERAD